MAQLFRLSIVIIFLLSASLVIGKECAKRNKGIRLHGVQTKLRIKRIKQALINKTLAEEAYFSKYEHKIGESGVTQ